MSQRMGYHVAHEEALRRAIDDIANQLALAVDGRFDFTIKAPIPDETLDKLAMLVNFVVENARRTLGALEEKNVRLAELDHLKSVLLANVSHELRTPLALILGPTEKWLTAASTGPEEKRDLEIVMRNARALLTTVNDLLDASKLEAGGLKPRYTRVNLAALVRQTCSLFEGLARERGVAFVTEIPREVRADVDPDMIQRVLINLLSNAFKFGLGGAWVSCVLEASATSAELRVQDRGPGIPSGMRKKIFERFIQLEGEATRRAGGTGLGLAIAKDFVELHAGTIEAADAPGGGAMFIVRFPLRAPEGVEVDESGDALSAPSSQHAVKGVIALEATLEPSGSAKGVVLVVEDNPEMNEFIASSLVDEYRVVSASNGREGLDEIERQKPDLVLTDVMMPEMKGDELVRRIREDRGLDAMPVVVLTAKADDALRVQLLEMGAQDYVMKPFSRTELKARLRNLISAKKAGDVLRKELDSREDDLEALVREVTLRRHELEKALDEARRARDEVNRLLQLRDEFISVASHELKTPLTPMSLQTQMLSRVMKTNTSEAVKTERVRAYLDMCGRQIEMLLQLIETLLDVSRIRLGHFLLTKTPGVDLAEVTQAVVARHRAHWEMANSPVTVHVEGSPPLGRWDRVRLEQVVSNLVSNAIKYGGGHPIDIVLSHDERTATFAVRDYGVGISPEDQARIFNRFERAGSIKSFGGLGLGLYISRQIVSSHGGTIRVESEPGAGSTFIVELPLDAP